MTHHLHPALAAAERLAPEPRRRDHATTGTWALHFAGQALAAYATFRDALHTLPRNAERDSRPDLGYLVGVAVAATAAACAPTTPPEKVGLRIWNLTPEAGALNGEYVDWLAETLDRLGVNPADIDTAFSAGDFRSPCRPAPTACGRCKEPFDPADLHFDGRAESDRTGFCRGCVDRCHEAGADHQCVICCAHDRKVDDTQLDDPDLHETCPDCGAEWTTPRGPRPIEDGTAGG
jgi:hypothetical protein